MNRNCVVALIFAVVTGFVSLILFLTDAIEITSASLYTATLIYSGASLIAMLVSRYTEGENGISKCRACCIDMALAGEALAIIVSLLAPLAVSYTSIWFEIANAFLIFDIALALGGQWCLLYAKYER